MNSKKSIYQLKVNCDEDPQKEILIIVNYDSPTRSIYGSYIINENGPGVCPVKAGPKNIEDNNIDQYINKFANEISNDAISEIRTNSKYICSNPEKVSIEKIREIQVNE